MNVNINFSLDEVFLDIETLDHKPNSPIIEMTILSRSGEPYFDEVICPGDSFNLSSYKVNVLGYDKNKLTNAKKLSEYIPGIKQIIKDKAVIAYGQSDLNRLPWIKKHAVYLDCCQRFSDRYGLYNAYHGNHTWVSLENACSQIGYLPNGKPHRSRTDAESCRNVWLHLDEIEADFKFPFEILETE